MMLLVTFSWVGATQLLKATFTGVLTDIIRNVTDSFSNSNSSSSNNVANDFVIISSSGGNSSSNVTEKEVRKRKEALIICVYFGYGEDWLPSLE